MTTEEVTSVVVGSIEIDVQSLSRALRAAAVGGVPVRQLAGDGSTWAGLVLTAIGNKEPIRSVLALCVREMLSGPTDEARFAASYLVDQRPDLVERADLVGAIRRADLDERSHVVLASALAQPVLDGKEPYDKELFRGLADDQRYWRRTIGVSAVFDHAWFLARLGQCSPEHARAMLVESITAMNDDEHQALASELVRLFPSASFTAWWVELVDEAAKEPARRRGVVRWA